MNPKHVLNDPKHLQKKKDIYFDNKAKEFLSKGGTHTTIRYGKEKNRYKLNMTYKALGAKGTDWGFDIKVIMVIRTRVKNLKKFMKPEDYEASKYLINKLDSNERIDLIKFRVIKK